MRDHTDRKTRIREYKETPPSAGVFRVRNTISGKSLVGSTVNLPGTLNRQRFQLAHGSHPDPELQSDWNELGPGAFEFEVLDQLEQKEDSVSDLTEELAVLKTMWIENLDASGEILYRRSGKVD